MGYTEPAPAPAPIQSINSTAGACATVRCENAGDSKTVASPRRNRRSRRRSQRHGVQQPSPLPSQQPQEQQDQLQPHGELQLQSRVEADKESSVIKYIPVSRKTIVVPVSDESQQVVAEAKPTNRAFVRRRPKAASTVTKVITDASLETLRAKRNGAVAEGSMDDGQVIEEVSRFLLMCSAGHGSRQHILRRPVECLPTFGGAGGSDASAVDAGDAAAAAAAATAAAATATVAGGTPDSEQRPGGGYVSVQTMHAHLTSLIRTGRLPPDSVNVLRSILSHSRRGRLAGLDPQRGDIGDFQIQAIPDYSNRHLEMQLQVQQQQQQQMDAMHRVTVGEFSVYEAYDGRPQMGFYDPAVGQPADGTDYTCSGCGNGSVNDNDIGHFIGNAEQHAPPAHSRGLYTYGGSLDFGAETAVCPNGDAANENFVTAASDDDDAEVVAMLRGICEMVQQPASPLRPSCWADEVNGEDESQPSVTVSQAERESLRTIQQAFRIHMRAAGSPEWTSPPLRKLLCNADGPVEGAGAADEENRWATNRTLFSYHTALVDETEETPRRLPMNEGWSMRSETSQASEALTDARLSSLFSAMRLLPDDKDGTDTSIIHNSVNISTPWLCRRMDEGNRADTPATDGVIRATPHHQLGYHQPTTQKKQLLFDGRSPYSPTACDFSTFTPPTAVKSTTVLNSKAKPFVPKGFETAVSTVYFE